MIPLGLLFLLTAFLYASVGFGGGSTYNALLVLNGTDYRILPAIALVCNVVVVSGGVWRFAKNGHLPLRRILPLIVTSVPAAWIGGRIPITQTLFTGLLGLSLAIAGIRLLLEKLPESDGKARSLPLWVAPITGAGLGLLSGLVGIGGGIFLAPILHFLRWDNARVIAGTCSFFILVNSVSGFAGQLAKLSDLTLLSAFGAYWLLFPAVLIGGQLGSYVGASLLGLNTMRKMTGVLILYVSGRLLLQWSGLLT